MYLPIGVLCCISCHMRTFSFVAFRVIFFSLSIVSVRFCCFRCHLSSSLICHRRPWINVFLCLFFIIPTWCPIVLHSYLVLILFLVRELSPRLLSLFLRSREVSTWHWLCVRDQALGRRLPGGEEYPPPPSDVSHGFSRFKKRIFSRFISFMYGVF